MMFDRRQLIRGVTAAMAGLTACQDPLKRSITVVSYGAGSYQASHQQAFLAPYSKTSGVHTDSVAWNAEYGKLKTMVESQRVSWDVVDATAAVLARGKRDGLFERIEPLPDTGAFLPGTVDPYGVGNVYWATVMAYDPKRFSAPPRTWGDFYDLKKFPGPRALYDDPRGNIEFALLALGVPRDQLYPFTAEKITQAFAILSSIRDAVRVWWNDGSQPVQLLMTQQVALSSAWSGRIFASPQASQVIAYPWDGAALELDYWVIPKGSPHKKEAVDFINFASRPDHLAAQAAMIGYGPVNTDALSKMSTGLLKQLPTYNSNFRSTFVVDAAQWEQYEDELRSKWLNWKTTGKA